MRDFETIQIKPGVRLHIAATDKFKTNYIGFTFHRPLSAKEVTVNSLLSAVMPRGCKSYPDTASLNKRFDELYGADMTSLVRKKAESQLLCFSFEFANERYISDDVHLFNDVSDLAKELIFDHSPFDTEHVAQEKENLRTLIMSVFNDKRTYAQIRMIEEMCKDEPYGILDIGRIEDIPKITAETLDSHYKNVILHSPLDIFFVGNAQKDEITALINSLTGSMTVTEPMPTVKVIKSAKQIKNVVQHEKITQAKLSMGFRTSVSASEGDTYALTVYNAIFGGGPYSRLFNNVREKMSLCYYVSSRTDRFKGIMSVNAGIECDKFEVARDAILEQEQIVRTGAFSDDELESAKLGLVDALRGISDSQRRLEDFCLGQLMSGSNDGLSEYIDGIMSVTRERVIEAAKDVQLDTVYLLTKED